MFAVSLHVRVRQHLVDAVDALLRSGCRVVGLVIFGQA